jgi:hypothetical protein
MKRALAACAILATASIGACLPYSVGSTARTVPRGELTSATSLYVIPGAVKVPGESLQVPMRGIDPEVRWGLDDRSDIGFRAPSMNGAVVTYKRRLDGPSSDPGAGIAGMGGIGFVNGGEHGYFELTFIASGRESPIATPYGGLRVMQVVPLSETAVQDDPTSGGFLGLRLGSRDLGVSPEIGVYYDRSALHVRDRRVIFVPSITIHGDRLWRILRDMGALHRSHGQPPVARPPR